MASGDGSITTFIPPDGSSTFADGTPIPTWLGPLPDASPTQQPTLTPTPIPWYEQIGAQVPATPVQQNISDLINEADTQWATFGQFIPGIIGPMLPPTVQPNPIVVNPPSTPTTPAPPYLVPPTITIPNPTFTGAPPVNLGFYHSPTPPYQAAQITIDKTAVFIKNPFGDGFVPNPFYDASYQAPKPTITIPNPAYNPPKATPTPTPSTNVNVTVNDTIGNDLSGALRVIADAITASGGQVSQSLSADNATMIQFVAQATQGLINGLGGLGASLSASVSGTLSGITTEISKMLSEIESIAGALLKALWDELLATLKGMAGFFFDEFEKRFMETVTI